MAGGLDSPDTEFAPFLLEPRLVDKVWGFRDLRPWYDYVAGDDGESAPPIGEVWLTGDE